MTVHWHAFSYTGKGYTDAEVRKGLAPSAHPRPEISQWVSVMPTLHIFAEDEIDKAMDWLEGELTSQVPQDAEHHPVEDRLQASRRRLDETRNRDVVYGYWSLSKQYCSRGLIACTVQH
ncbi:hypothetical protein ABZS76_32675 [Streptomyces sp. NPDC005562]|uniref:hypothetical protein n=1 Tax=Streptomyces sp. NPDC005562 TaxID=3154890 RepID=UPI0033AA4022